MKVTTILAEAFRGWKRDKAPQLAASTAYYTVFSLVPLILIIFALLGLFLDPEVVRGEVLGQLQSLVGVQGAETIRSMLEAADASPHTPLMAVIGFATLALGATGLLIALQDACNFIWNVEAKKGVNSLFILIMKRLFSMGLLLSIGFLLLVSLAASAGVAFAMQHVSARLEGVAFLLPILNGTVSFVIICALFALLFKYLPDVRVPWRHVWPGAAFTAVLFILGKAVLGWYVGGRDFASAYGAAGSLIVLLLWVNYSAQIFFFGVECVKAMAMEKGTVKPRPYARFQEVVKKEPAEPAAEEHDSVLPKLLIGAYLLMRWKFRRRRFVLF